MKLSPEQQAATAIDSNLVVNAGAGSGKTTVLTSRYLRLLTEGGLGPDQIVAITFTRKAAREMRERIDANLALLAASGDSRWKEARDQLALAPISTIHSFYARILRAFPVEARIDPSFRVLDELEANIMLHESLGKTIQLAAEEKCPHLSLLGEVMGSQVMDGRMAWQLRDIYKSLLNRGIQVEEACLSKMYGQLPTWQECRDEFVGFMAGEPELAKDLGAKDSPEMANLRHSLVVGAEIVSKLKAAELADWYQDLLPLTKLKGGRVKGHKDFVIKGVELLCRLLTVGLAPLMGEATLSIITGLDRVFREAKAKAGGLDYSDLQFEVYNLLKTRPEVISKLRQRYKTYMIDEFQDTDRLQQKIIALLVESEGEITPGRLFVVGDEKQSIYRFRGAEVRVFDEVRQQLTRSNPQQEKRITCNYRSRQPLIELINSLFTRLMDTGQGSEIKYIELSAHRGGEEPCAELLDCNALPGESSPEAEARNLAARIRRMVEGRQELARDDQDQPRPVRYGDIAVLIRARTHLQEYEHQLRLAGIPYTVVGGVGFYQQQEVQDIINLLKVVNNLRDDLALAAVLRSPLFALDDDSLLTLAQTRRERGGTLLDHGPCLSPDQHRLLVRAGEIIAALRDLRGRMEIPALLDLAMDLTQFRELSLTRFAGLQRYANLEKLMDLATQYSAFGQNLGGFLQWLDYAADQDEAEAMLDSEDSDSVRIMTIHASKGLEFPVVFLPLCSSKFSVRPGSMLVDEEGRLAFKHPWPCHVWKESLANETAREMDEFKRLLYVAVTRAKDWLVALVQEPGKKETSFNMWLQELAGKEQHFVKSQSLQDHGNNIILPHPLPIPESQSAWNPRDDFPGLAAVGHGRRTFRYFSISQFMLWQGDREEFDRRYLSRWVEDSREEGGRIQDWENEPGGAKFGTLLHGAMEKLQPDTDVSILLKDLISRYFPGVDRSQWSRIFHAAKSLLEAQQKQPDPPGNFIQAENELEFYYRLGDALFYGLIDRLLIAGDKVAVLDYKTNRIPEEGVETIVETYTPQLRFYAMAASEIYHLPARAYLQLLRLTPGKQLVEIAVSDRDKAELREELKRFVRYCTNNN